MEKKSSVHLPINVTNAGGGIYITEEARARVVATQYEAFRFEYEDEDRNVLSRILFADCSFLCYHGDNVELSTRGYLTTKQCSVCGAENNWNASGPDFSGSYLPPRMIESRHGIL